MKLSIDQFKKVLENQIRLFEIAKFMAIRDSFNKKEESSIKILQQIMPIKHSIEETGFLEKDFYASDIIDLLQDETKLSEVIRKLKLKVFI